jgi:RNA polymerase primary sigma factor
MEVVVKPRRAPVRGTGLPKGKARRTASRPIRSPTLETEGALAKYFGALADLPLLDAAQEISLAREIEARELAHWCTLLSARPALAVVASATAPRLHGRPTRLEALRASAGEPGVRRTRARMRTPMPSPALRQAARQLRRLDRTREGLRAADAAVHSAFSENERARAYLARVATAAAAEQRAKNRFIAANLRLVIAMAQRYRRSPLALEDLIQEGNLGLMRAVERYDHRRGLRFSTYATWWIRHALNRAVSDKARLVRIPVHALDDLSRVSRAVDSIQIKTGAAPSADELASQTGMSVTKLEQLKLNARLDPPASLDHAAGRDNEQTWHDRLASAQTAEVEEELDLARWHEELPRLLHVLRPIEAAIVRFRYGLDGDDELTLKQIGEKYNLSRERIRQLQVEALVKLRNAITGELDPAGSDQSAA